MKKKSRRAKSSEASQQPRKQTTARLSEEIKTSGNREKPRKTVHITTDGFYHEKTPTDTTVNLDFSVTTTDNKQKQSKSSGRLSTAVCRLCHGKFSPRSLRHAFNKWSQDSISIVDDGPDTAAQSPLLFHSDFQRLVGVQLNRDPTLSEFICKKCHTKFYKCHNILIRFLQRVNLPPLGKENLKSRSNAKSPESTGTHGSTTPQSFTSDSKRLHSLVSWAHHHGEACRFCPDLTEVLQGQCWGSVKAVWGCVDGHRYIMDTQCNTASNPGYTVNFSSGALESGNAEGVMSDVDRQEEEEDTEDPSEKGRTLAVAHPNLPAFTQTQSSSLADWTNNNEGHGEAMSPAPVQLEERTADSDLSDGVLSENEFEDSKKGELSDDELFEPFPDKRTSRAHVSNKRRQSPKAPEEPKIKKKPGPKPGWKNKFKPKGEELPNIYKCPYQGCTAVYRAPDGLKKHIKEHHEEVKERPCPHPGCNKVFMIDRYLQRHVKLIHTEERNYICDQCGQTFKQRKHLSVHQMRHSGAKPLQ